MNLISVEHLPPLTLVSKGKALTTTAVFQSRISQQARNVPPLTIVSKGKAVANNTVGKDQLRQVIQKGKATNPNSSKQSLPLPLVVIQKSKAPNPNSRKQYLAKGKTVRPKITKKPLILEKYDNVSAPAPLFGPFKSKIPLALKMPMRTQKEDSTNRSQLLTDVDLTTHETEWTPDKSLIDIDLVNDIEWPQHRSLMGASNAVEDAHSTNRSQLLTDVDLTTHETEWTPDKSLIDIDLVTNDIEWPQHRSLMGASNAVEDTHVFKSVLNDVTNLEDPSGIIMEIADKDVQTECFCQCYNRGSNSGSDIIQALQEVAKELKDLKLNITGKTATKLMARIIPIRSEADLNKIHYNMENSENFELRLKLFLKYLKPKNSTTITTAFKDLIHDDFLKGRNWDGSNNSEALNN